MPRSYNSYQPVDLRKKSFNVQCYCDVRDFEYLARALVNLGVIEIPVKASTVLNEVIITMKNTLERKEEQSTYKHTAEEAIQGLRELGIQIGQFKSDGDRRGSLLTRHLQSDELAIGAGDQGRAFVSGIPLGMSPDNAKKAAEEIDKLNKKDHEDFSALGVVPDSEDIVGDDQPNTEEFKDEYLDGIMEKDTEVKDDDRSLEGWSNIILGKKGTDDEG